MTLRTLRNLILWLPACLLVWWCALACWGAAPTPTLYILPSTAARMDPHPVFACIDCGRRKYPIAGATIGGWTNTSGSEYRLDATLASLSVSGSTPINITVKENGPQGSDFLSEGTVGALAAGEWGQSGGSLYVRLSDGSNPQSASTVDEVLLSFDVSTTGDSKGVEFLTIKWSCTGGTWSSVVPARYTTDPRSQFGSQQIDLAGTGSSYNNPKGFNCAWVPGPGTWTIQAVVTNSSGESTTVSDTVTIDANSRTNYDIGSGGDFPTLTSAISTHGSTANIQYTLLGNYDETISSAANMPGAISGSNSVVVWDGTGTRPKFTYTGTTNPSNALIRFSGENNVAYGIDFDDASDGTYATTLANANNKTAFVDVNAVSVVERGFDPGGTGMLILNCTVLGTDDSYTWISDGNYYGLNQGVAFGLTAGTSDTESVVRFSTQEHYINLQWCDLTYSSIYSKAALRFYQGAFCHVGQCQINGGSSPLGRGDQSVSAACLRLDSNEWIGTTIEISSIDQLMYCNNYNNGAFRIEASEGGIPSSDITIIHNTCTTRNVLYLGDDDETEYTNCRYAANLFTAAASPQGRWLNVGDGCIDVVNNQFNDVNAATAFATVYIGGSIHNTHDTTTALNTETWASGNITDAYTLDAQLVPSSPNTAATEAGVLSDYAGNTRGSTSNIGASNATAISSRKALILQ